MSTADPPDNTASIGITSFRSTPRKGWAVFFCNPRGSTGYGQKFERGIVNNWGGMDYQDIMAGVDAAFKENPWIDQDRLGVTGGSYGGFMTNWIVGHTNRFKAAVTLRSVSNFISDDGTRDGAYGHEDDFKGFLFDDFDQYWNASPLKYAKNVKTPTLILHSDNDYRVPIEQGEQWFRALKHYGVNAELVIFPRENHNLTRTGEPKHLVESLELAVLLVRPFSDGRHSGQAARSIVILTVAREALLCEAEALRTAAERLDNNLVKAVEAILSRPGKVIVTGLGKSGHIGRKLAATLSSTGTPSVFLHAAEAAHGDLGVCSPGEVVIILSKSGSTSDLLNLVPIFRKLDAFLIGILGNLQSPLAAQLDAILDARVSCEADPLNLTPTASTTVALGIGDALAIALMRARSFSDADFARNHPGGQLGRNLHLTVEDVMHSGDEVAWAAPEDSLRHVVIEMTRHNLGAACIVDKNRRLEGLITDGDVRRALQAHDDIRPLRASDVMTRNPTRTHPESSLKSAIEQMENRPSQISVLPVVDEQQRCVGLVRIHDVYRHN